MFRRTKGFAGCILLCARSPWLEGGRNPFAFGKSTLEKQINTEITAWQVPLLSQLFLPRSVQQHRGFGSKATSESLFPLQSLILIYEQDLAGKWTHVGKQANSFFFFPFFIIIFGFFFAKGMLFSEHGSILGALVLAQSRAASHGAGSGGASSVCSSPNHSLSSVVLSLLEIPY